VQHRLLLRGRHPFENHLEVIDLGNAHAKVLGSPVADLGLAHPARAADLQHLPPPVPHVNFLAPADRTNCPGLAAAVPEKLRAAFAVRPKSLGLCRGPEAGVVPRRFRHGRGEDAPPPGRPERSEGPLLVGAAPPRGPAGVRPAWPKEVP
jgi:hypothetical protein